MTVESRAVKLQTRYEGELIDLTDKVQSTVERSNIRDGVAVLFIPGSTAALTTIEYEPGLVADFPAALDRLIPKDISYKHERRWSDGNGHSHVRAALLGPDLTVPFTNGKLMLGKWQQIVFIELDVRPRDRTVYVQLLGT